MPSQLLSKIPSAAEFAERFRNIKNDFLAYARDLAAALDVNPRLADELQQQGIDRGIVRRLERLGRGQIHPSLLFSTTPGGMKLLSVPLSEQTLALENGVEVLDTDENTTRNIPIHELNHTQAVQVLAGGRIRTIAEQRTWLRDHKPLPTERDSDFRVHRDYVVTARPGKWTKALILQWLGQMS